MDRVDLSELEGPLRNYVVSHKPGSYVFIHQDGDVVAFPEADVERLLAEQWQDVLGCLEALIGPMCRECGARTFHDVGLCSACERDAVEGLTRLLGGAE